MKPIYVDDEIHKFLKTQKKKYGTFNNVVKAVLEKLTEFNSEIIELKTQKENERVKDKDFMQVALLESLRNPASSYSGDKTLNIMPTTRPLVQSKPKDDLMLEMYNIFGDIDVENGLILPSKVKEAVEVNNKKLKEKKQLIPPPIPPKKE